MQCKRTLLCALAILFSSCSSTTLLYINDPDHALQINAKRILILPCDSLHVGYIDNTKAIPDTLFRDSFFTKAAQDFVEFEGKKRYQLCRWKPDSLDSLSLLYTHGFSRINKDTVVMPLISKRILNLAEKHHADLVLILYKCDLKNNAVRGMGWREDKFAGPAYERPVTYSATTRVHVQIWDKNGTLLYERVGVNTTNRPVLYSLLNREKKPDKDLVKYANRIYAPSLVKSLYASIRSAMMVRF